MFPKRLLQKAMHQHVINQGGLSSTDLNIQMILHYGIPSTASILAFDPIQRILAIGTLDGRIKIIGGDNIECLLVSPIKAPYKHLEFLHNQGYVVSVSNENDIRVWDLEHRHVACYLQWESNITAFSVIQGTAFMYVGDEYGVMSVLRFDVEEAKLLLLPYRIPATVALDAAKISVTLHPSVVGVFPQPCIANRSRVLIAYDNGLIILWDVSEDRIVLVRGYTDLQAKNEGGAKNQSSTETETCGQSSDLDHEEKEICSLCWASADGSVLAVGYTDGDVLFWNISSGSSTKEEKVAVSSSNVVKLQLSSGKRRIPVIVLHWSATKKSKNGCGGQLYIYGGDEIGSEEVLTVLSLEWSSRLESLRCVSRLDLTLHGSFADMILLPGGGSTLMDPAASLFVLTNPGQLHAYDGTSLCTLSSPQEEKPQIQPEPFPELIPLLDPCITVGKLITLPKGGNYSKILSEVASAGKGQPLPVLPAGTNWPLTGGVPSTALGEGLGIERMYVAGYQDGSVRIWDATNPVFSILFVLEGEINGIKVPGDRAPVSALEFCCVSGSLAVGNECGLVRVYTLVGGSGEMGCQFVSETVSEAHSLHYEGFHCAAMFSVLKSSISALTYSTSGGHIAVGCGNGQVSMLDIRSFLVLFLTDSIPGSSTSVISVILKSFKPLDSPVNSPKVVESKSPKQDSTAGSEFLFVLTRNARIVIFNGLSGSMISSRPVHPKSESIAVAMHIIDGGNSISGLKKDKHSKQLFMEDTSQMDSKGSDSPSGSKSGDELRHLEETTSYSEQRLMNPLLLLCCEDALRLYGLSSVIQGENNSIYKASLGQPCCWSATFRSKEENAYGLILLYQNGLLEIRSLPNFAVIEESSLMSILRWNFKTNFAKTMSSTENGHVTLINGSELAIVSILASENAFRIPDSLPSLHDEVLAAAADAAINSSVQQIKKQVPSQGILGGIIKGIKAGKVGNAMGNSTLDLISIFSRNPFADQSTKVTDDVDVEILSIDDIEIDDALPMETTMDAHTTRKVNKRDEEAEREQLFHGAKEPMKPRLRRPEEIMAHYRKAGDASEAAGRAREKLLQRQEKLQRISKRTEDLQNDAESFASMANELVKAMEEKKWWKI
ncbi:hypothetical protein AMTRI_Chr08g208540 [Amborella trichopoda]